MISLYVVIIIVVIIFWFLVSGFYKPFGKFVCKIISDSINNMKEDE